MLGASLIIVGAIFLLKHFNLISGSVWEVVWPIVLIVIGLMLMLRKKGL